MLYIICVLKYITSKLLNVNITSISFCNAYQELIVLTLFSTLALVEDHQVFTRVKRAKKKHGEQRSQISYLSMIWTGQCARYAISRNRFWKRKNCLWFRLMPYFPVGAIYFI